MNAGNERTKKWYAVAFEVKTKAEKEGFSGEPDVAGKGRSSKNQEWKYANAIPCVRNQGHD